MELGGLSTKKNILRACLINNVICELGLYKFSKNAIYGVDTERNNEELSEKAYFTIEPDLWQRIGFEYIRVISIQTFKKNSSYYI